MKLAVIGDPVEHSASPRLHARLLEGAALEGSSVAIRVPAGRVQSAIARLQSQGFTGCNVTYPLKEEAVAACQRLTQDAQRTGAVNALFFGREVVGTQTDGVGARSAIEALVEEPIALKRIGVLGYGATGRAILAELHDNDAYAYVWGRDAERVRAACERYQAGAWPSANVPEIVVSALPPDASLPDSLVADLQRPDVVIDVNYGTRATLARRIGRDVVCGEAMLEAQARASFAFWLSQSTKA